MTESSQEETNALVCGRIHDLEFQMFFTIDGVDLYNYCYWLDHHSINYKFKELIYDTCCTSIIGLPDFEFYQNIISKFNWCMWQNSFPLHVGYYMEKAIHNKRYVLICLDSDGTENPVIPDVINSEILFGPKGAVL